MTDADAPAALPLAPTEEGSFRVGSEAHKRAFCRMLLDTHDPCRPAILRWPVLDAGPLARLSGLPIWDMAVPAEGNAALGIQSYAETIADPLVREAVTLAAFEARRHKEVLSHLVVFYGIPVRPEPPYERPAAPEWAWIRTGMNACIDSFFAFGLFALARRSGFLPAALVETFDPVIEDACRHLLFFANWYAWRRRTLPLWSRPVFFLRSLGALAAILGERMKSGRDPGGGDDFTMTDHESFGDGLNPRTLADLCLAENDRRMRRYDQRLVRPTWVPFLVRLMRPLLGRPQRGVR